MGRVLKIGIRVTTAASSSGLKADLCWGCRRLREVAVTDEGGRTYCVSCAPAPAPSKAMILLDFLLSTVPFQVGDRVSCKTGAQIYDGIGRVVEVSFDPKDLASPVVPMFRVVMEEKAYPEMDDEAWYSEACMSLAGADG